MPSDAANADQVAYWNEAAGPTWAALQDELDRQIEPLGRAAMIALAPQAGERLLDIGCGAGQTTLALAERVGPTGTVLGVDISHPLLKAARRRAAARGLTQASFAEADAQTHAFTRNVLDGAFSRFGVMFFSDPTAAFANIRTSLKSRGRLAFVAWRSMMENPWMTIPLGAGLRHLPTPELPEPNAPGPFAFADAKRVRAILSDAGFSAIDIEPLDAQISNDPASALKTALSVGPLGSLLRESPDARPAVEEAVRDALAAHRQGERIVMDSATWIVSARNG